VRDEQDRLASIVKPLNAFNALLLKRHVSNREDFIQQQDVRIDLGGNSKGG
jgi:hypothetical protein